MQGSNAEVISRYLNELVTTTDKITIETIMDNIEQKRAIRLDEISIERGGLLDKAEKDRLSTIERIRLYDYQAIINSISTYGEHDVRFIYDHEILKTIHPHPTLSEAIMEATADAYGESIHI